MSGAVDLGRPWIRRCRLAAAAATLGAVLGTATLPADSQAYYGRGLDEEGADLISADYERLEQGDDSTVYAAVSADGRYVAMQTRARNFFADDDPDPVGQYRAGGVFVFDLETRSLEKAADGDLFDEETNAFLRRGASNPSISADGRFVAFATAEPLVAADGNENVDVYVRDMALDESDPSAFDLVSARSGGSAPASYGPPPIVIPGSNPGTDMTRGVALSADGRYVVFRTEVATDLPDRAAVDVPAGQVFVRDRQTQATRLITLTDPGGEPAGGALGASISGDGTAVAWTGSNAPAQTRFLNGESQDTSLYYYLYKRVGDGPAAPTRRVTGVADPDDPACPPGAVTNFDPTSSGPCYGPLTEQEASRSSIISQVPVMGHDGDRVAFLTGSGPRPVAFKGPGLDLFVTDMSQGVSRKQGTMELTRATAVTDPAPSSPISGLAMAAGGDHIAITTARTTFVLDTPTLASPSRTIAGIRELYVVDLAESTLDRVARAYAGGDTDGDVATLPSISADGEQVAFTSFAGNLFFGDANQRPDAFVATRQPDPGTEPPPPPDDDLPPGVITSEDLRAKAVALGKGAVVLRVTVPAAGGVKAVADARVGKSRRRATVATGTGRATAAGTLEIVLRVVRRYRGELRRRGRIRSFAELDFVASAGGARVSSGVDVVFRQKADSGRKRKG